MKRNVQKGIAGVLTAAALTMALAGCGQDKQQEAVNFEFESYPMQTDATLSYWLQLNSNVSSVSEDLGKTPFAQELEKQTGVDVKFIHPPLGQEADQLNILLASEDLPDIIENDWYNFAGGPAKALQDDFIIDLTDVIAKDSPNLAKYLKEHPEVDKMVKTDDNQYYVYPFIRGDEKLLIMQGIVVRQDWLDELGLDMPETIDEWHTVLTAFKEKKGAQAPLSYQPYMLTSGGFMGAYGILQGFTVENGKVIYGPADPRYKEFLTTFAQWYKEGLIDTDIANVDLKANDATVLNGRTGVSYGFAGSGLGKWMQALQEKDPKAVLAPAPNVAAKKGETPKIGYKDTWYSPQGGAAITSSCKNVSLAARFLDYGYSEEGYKLFNFGIEGESYNMVDGYPTYTDKIMKNPDGLNISSAMGQYFRSNYNGPFVQAKEYVEQYYTTQEQKDALDVWGNSEMEKYQLPKITFTPEESSEAANIMNNIKTYVDEKTVRYIMGLEDLSNFESTYMNDLKNFGLDRLLELYQTAYDRYMKR